MDGNDTAYPIAFDTQNGLQVFSGLTKRELFAAMAMSGIAAIAPDGAFPSRGMTIAQADAKLAVEYADALLAALNAEESK